MNTEKTKQEKELSTSTKLNEMLLMEFVANVMQQSAKGTVFVVIRQPMSPLDKWEMAGKRMIQKPSLLVNEWFAKE